MHALPATPQSSGSRFATTHWSLIRSASAERSQVSAALEELCERYWYPLYAYVRRKGVDAEEAKDVTQAFFMMLLERRDLAAADPERGRFRSFLLGAMNHFLLNQWRAARTEKRGGGRQPLSLDVVLDDGESRYSLEPVDHQTPEQVYARRWALSVLAAAMEALRVEMVVSGKAQQFEAFRSCLDGTEHATYSEIGASVGMSEVAARVAVHRMREKFRRCLRRLIGQTVATEAEIDAELQDLARALAGPA